MSQTLYDLTDQCAQLLRALEAIDAMEMPDADRKSAHDALEAEYWGAEGDLAVKAEGYVRITREIEARAAVRKAEAARLADLARSDSNQAKRLTERLKDRLSLLGYGVKRPLQTALFKIGIQGNGGVRALEIKDEDALRAVRPDLFKIEVVTTYICDKERIKAEIEAWEAREAAGREVAVKAGTEFIPSPPLFDGVTLHQRGTRLVVK